MNLPSCAALTNPSTLLLFVYWGQVMIQKHVNIALFVEAQTENIYCFSSRPVDPSIINGDGVKFYVQYYYTRSMQGMFGASVSELYLLIKSLIYIGRAVDLCVRITKKL